MVEGNSGPEGLSGFSTYDIKLYLRTYLRDAKILLRKLNPNKMKNLQLQHVLPRIREAGVLKMVEFEFEENPGA